MKTEWDYTNLADAYLLRPDYSQQAIDAMLSISHVAQGARVCDVGAGVAHLTLMLADKKLDVVAVEPNDAMRANGVKRTAQFSNVVWNEGTGEQTGQQSGSFSLVTFGSSFNVCDRQKALNETSRILAEQGWFACMWNHRDLTDPIQAKIEDIIKSVVPAYGYGTRREDQTQIIESNPHFQQVIQLSSKVIHQQSIEDCIEAWRSHATLERQSGENFGTVLEQISAYLLSLNCSTIEIPYTTNIWMAQKR